MPAPTRSKARRWASIRNARDYSGLSTRTLRRRVADGSLPAYRPAGSHMLWIDLDDLDAMITRDGRIPAVHLEAITSPSARR
jgi:excisionase family DNA binding protein